MLTKSRNILLKIRTHNLNIPSHDFLIVHFIPWIPQYLSDFFKCACVYSIVKLEIKHISMEESTGQRLVKKISVVSTSKPTSTAIVQDIYGRTEKIRVSYLIQPSILPSLRQNRTVNILFVSMRYNVIWGAVCKIVINSFFKNYFTGRAQQLHEITQL